jgi:hypothetical protein
MRVGWLVAGLVTAGFCGVPLPADGPLRSGPQPGQSIPGAFHPYNVTGPEAGKLHCLVCEYGLNPVAMVFAREVSEPLVRLLGRLDAAADEQRRHDLGCFVVFLRDRNDALDKQLLQLAQRSKLRRLVLSIDDPAGPEDYHVAPEADITVVLYHRHVVKANHAFRKGQLGDKEIERIMADLPKILPSR